MEDCGKKERRGRAKNRQAAPAPSTALQQGALTEPSASPAAVCAVALSAPKRDGSQRYLAVQRRAGISQVPL